MELNEDNINKFSWRRAYEFGMMHKSAIRVQLIICAVIVLLAYLFMLQAHELSSNFNIGLFTVMSSIITYLLYMSPLAFARRDDSLITQIPAKASEKFTFYLIYALVIIPVFTEAIWYMLNYGVGILFNIDGNIERVMQTHMMKKYGLDLSYSTIALTVINTLIQTGAIIMSVTYVVLRSHHHRMLKGILTPLGILFVIGMASGICGGIIALLELQNPDFFDTADKLNETEFVNHIVSSMATVSIIVDAIAICCIAYISYLIFRMLQKRQVA